MHRWKFPVLVGLLLVVAAAGGGSGGTAQAATTRVWTGLSSLNWNTAANWDPVGVPVAGDSVVIGATAYGKTLNNDAGYFDVVNNRTVDLVLDTLSIGTSVKIVGNGLGISAAIQMQKPENISILDIPVVLRGDAQVSLATATNLLMRSETSPAGVVALEMSGHTLTKVGLGGLIFLGDLAGPGTIATNAGFLTFIQPVTFGGTISLSAGTEATLGTLTGNGAGPCGSAPNTTFVLSGAKLSVDCAVSVRSLAGTGEIKLLGQAARLWIAGTGGAFEGNISGARPSEILCCSAGSQTFRGASTFTGNFFVTSGRLTLDGATFPAASQFSAQGVPVSRPSLAGYGTFGETILTTANLAMAPVNGQFGFARFPTLQFAPDVGVVYEIKGATPGTGFTQIVMAGEIFLDDAGLLLTFGGYSPPAGQAFTLITGASGLSGTFSNAQDGKPLPEGAAFTAGGMQFTITYKGGAGHDVVITRQAGAATPTPTATPTATPPPTPGQTKFKRFVPFVAREN